MVYEKLSDSELDQLLLIAFQPKRKERINFSVRENFQLSVLSKLESFSLTEEFGENIIHFIKSHINCKNISVVAFTVFNLDMKIIKMAALKTYHENSEEIKV